MLTGFRDVWVEGKSGGVGLTFPADKPVKRIDYIFYNRGSALRTKRAWVVETLASDHRPVVAELEL